MKKKQKREQEKRSQKRGVREATKGGKKGVEKGVSSGAKKEVKKGGAHPCSLWHLWHQNGAKSGQKTDKKESEKRHGKKTAPGSILYHFGEPFGSLFGAKTVRERPRTEFSAKSVIVSKQ